MSGEGVGETEGEKDVEGVREGVPLLVREEELVAGGVGEKEGLRDSVGEPLAVGEGVPLRVGETLAVPLSLAVTVPEGVAVEVRVEVREVVTVVPSPCRRRGAPLVESHAGSKGVACAKDASNKKIKRGRDANIYVWRSRQER